MSIAIIGIHFLLTIENENDIISIKERRFMAKNDYTKESIQSLTPREHVRKRPSMYCGDTSTPNQLMMELFSNALDEHNIGHGDTIDVSIDKSGLCRIEDFAQGFLVDEMRDDGKTVFQAAFDTMNTSGKYTDDGVYEGSSLGLNGIGTKLVTYLSKNVMAETVREGRWECNSFSDGVLYSHQSGDAKQTAHTGTTVTYLPDEQFFGTGKTSVLFFKKFFNDITCICPTLTVFLNGEKISHNSIEDMLDEKRGKDIEIVGNHFVMNTDKINLAMTFTSGSQAKIIPYVNYGITSSGPHITGIKSTLTRVFNNWAKENNLLTAKDKNLDGAAIQEGIVLVCNINSKGVKYNAQVKDDIIDMDTSFTTALGQQLEVWLDSNPEDAKAILEKAILARKAAEAAKRARAAVKNNKKRGNKVKILNPDKLKDAEFLGQDSTLLVVEGLSAGASMCVAREIDKYGILMLRGKLINALANKDDRLLKNEEIQLLFKALGIKPYEDYEETNLRYGRIGICVDSDSDGYHIGLLIASALEHFCPKFIQENRLCWLRSPLYIVKGKDKEQYYFTDQEMDAARPNLPAGVEVQRCKGLGSLSASQARNSMFGENQHMDVLIPTDKTKNKLITLMGSNADGRKNFIFNNIDFSEVKE
jgi:topoisomerase-4 subunit B